MPDIPAYGEGETGEESIADLRVALGACLEAFGPEEAMPRLNPPPSLRQVDMKLEDLLRA